MTARKYDPTCSYPGCGRKHNARGLCGPHGAMQRKGAPLRPLQNRSGPIETPTIERFASRIALCDNGCIEWIGGKTIGGYGVFAVVATHGSERKDLAHRWSYEQHVGPIPDGFDVDHLCRNRPCVNPDHLEPVTRAENIRRAVIALCTLEGLSAQDVRALLDDGVPARKTHDHSLGDGVIYVDGCPMPLDPMAGIA